jgi:SLT domain-containing protein
MTTKQPTPKHKIKKQGWKEKNPSVIPLEIQNSLHIAMRSEKISAGEYRDLLWIMAQESGGIVNARSQEGSSARGLFQLLRMHYVLNPHGEKSFGNAIEECQGGIRYIRERYRSAAKAKQFWQSHHWY